jgi:sulfate adenylyltransferase subunit 2
MEESYNIGYLKQLEHESIHIFREAVAEFENPVMLYSAGKDSSVLLHLARKAFFPGKIPFPLMHIDTGFKPREMIEFRDYFVDKIGATLIVKKGETQEAKNMVAEDSHTSTYIYQKKTKPLLDGITEHKFDAAFGGARREEEKSRAKERVFSVRGLNGVWDPKNQRPELWHLYNGRLMEGQSMRVFPLSNWTEVDIWTYILEEQIEVVPLYFAKKHTVIQRNGLLLRVDEHVVAKEGEEIFEMDVRYRTLGCSPSTGVVESKASTIEDIIQEVLMAKYSERMCRAIDYTSESSMEKKKREGYF